MTEEERLAAEAAQREADEAAAEEAARIAAEAAEEEEGEDEGNTDDVADLEAAKTALAAARKAAAAARRAAAKAKADAAKFKGIDPAKARADAKAVAEAEKAQRAAEKAAATAEGNFEKLRELQNEEHQAALDAERTQRTAAEDRATAAEERLNRALLAAAFGSSTFITGETILTPQRAQRLYGDYVEIEDGETVVYDAPREAKRRTKIIDAKGNPLSFNDAIRKVVEAEPDKDTLLKSKVKPGGGSTTEEGKVTQPGGDRLSRLSKGLAALKG